MTAAGGNPCPRCGADAPEAGLACPQCGALIHAEALRQLYAAARQAEERRDWEEAMALLGRCLERLPPGTQQYRQIQEQLRRTAHLYGAEPARIELPGLEPARPPPEAPSTTPGASRPTARGARAIAVLVDSLRLMLRGLTRPRTVLSMAVWVITLSWLTGWRRALGFAAMVYVHEMGHLILIRMYGFRFAWPFFVPFLGAFVLQGDAARPKQDAVISLAGPAAGMALSAGLFWVDLAVALPDSLRSLVWLNGLINLMNLMPVWVLDGGRLAECSRRGQVLAVALALLALSVWPFSPFTLMLGAGFLLRALFWREFEAVRPAAARTREGRGEGMAWVLALTVVTIVAGGWMLIALRP